MDFICLFIHLEEGGRGANIYPEKLQIPRLKSLKGLHQSELAF